MSSSASLSTSAREQPSYSLTRDSGLHDAVCRAVCSRSLGLHARRWLLYDPCCFSPGRASCSRQLCSCSHTAETNSCTIDDSRDCIQHDTFIVPDTSLYNLTFHVFCLLNRSLRAEFVRTPEFICIWRSSVRIDEVGLGRFLFNQSRRKWRFHFCIFFVFIVSTIGVRLLLQAASDMLKYFFSKCVVGGFSVNLCAHFVVSVPSQQWFRELKCDAHPQLGCHARFTS